MASNTTFLMWIGGICLIEAFSGQCMSASSESFLSLTEYVTRHLGQPVCVEAAAEDYPMLSSGVAIEWSKVDKHTVDKLGTELGMKRRELKGVVLFTTTAAMKMRDNPLNKQLQNFSFAGTWDEFTEQLGGVISPPPVGGFSNKQEGLTLMEIDYSGNSSIREILLSVAAKNRVGWVFTVGDHASNGPSHKLQHRWWFYLTGLKPK